MISKLKSFLPLNAILNVDICHWIFCIFYIYSYISIKISKERKIPKLFDVFECGMTLYSIIPVIRSFQCNAVFVKTQSIIPNPFNVNPFAFLLFIAALEIDGQTTITSSYDQFMFTSASEWIVGDCAVFRQSVSEMEIYNSLFFLSNLHEMIALWLNCSRVS